MMIAIVSSHPLFGWTGLLSSVITVAVALYLLNNRQQIHHTQEMAHKLVVLCIASATATGCAFGLQWDDQKLLSMINTGSIGVGAGPLIWGLLVVAGCGFGVCGFFLWKEKTTSDNLPAKDDVLDHRCL